MNLAKQISGDVDTQGGGERPPSVGLIPDALPEVRMPLSAENSDTGVSTNYTRLATESGQKKVDLPPKEHWYALRVTYGREKKAYDYLVDKNVEAYYPTIITTKIVNGKRKTIEESRLPNMFFARGTEEVIKSYVYDNINLPYLRFYYRHYHEGRQILKEPLIVPDNQIKSLKIICASEAEDILFVPADVQKFKAGQSVRIIDGIFKGVVGKVARYHGQQRVAVIIDGLLTVASAYVPSAFLEPEE